MFYNDRSVNESRKVDEALQRFDSREEYESWLMEYAQEVHARIKEGDTEFLRQAVDDLGLLMDDMKKNFVIAEPCQSDFNAIQVIINAAQRRLYA